MLSSEQTFNALIREATFTKEVLCAGATQIRRANYSTPGIYAQSFSALTVGLERIGKLCLMLDHYIENGGEFPNLKSLKTNIGHKLELLYDRSREIVQRRELEFRFLSQLEHPIHRSILQVLHDYAEGDRYSNINLLVGEKGQIDPISRWYSSVDIYIFDNLITGRRKDSIRKNAEIVHAMMSGNAVIFHVAETGAKIDSFMDGSFRTGLFEAVAPYRQLYVLQIIRYWVELLWDLGDKAQALGRQEIPFFSEIFGGFYNHDTFLRSRKIWLF